MGVGAGLYMCDVVKKSSRSLSHLLMSSWFSLSNVVHHRVFLLQAASIVSFLVVSELIIFVVYNEAVIV